MWTSCVRWNLGSYAAGTWRQPLRVFVKAEHGPKGTNPRFFVTHLPGDPRRLYEQVYCARGDRENRIKEQPLGLFADRTSCHVWWANQFRLPLSSLAYILLESLCRLALAGTDLARAPCAALRLRLLKVRAVVLRNTRRIQFLLPEADPWLDHYLTGRRALRLRIAPSAAPTR